MATSDGYAPREFWDATLPYLQAGRMLRLNPT